jgi:hypothetical protein
MQRDESEATTHATHSMRVVAEAAGDLHPVLGHHQERIKFFKVAWAQQQVLLERLARDECQSCSSDPKRPRMLPWQYANNRTIINSECT